MLAIKLKLAGKKHQRMFRVVVAEKKSKLQGRYVDDLGFWNPHINKHSLDKEKTQKWIKSGAQPTAGVFNLLVKEGIIKGPKIPVHKKSKKPEEATAPASEPIVEGVVVNTAEEKPVSEEIISEPVVEKSNEEAKENQE